VCGDEPPPTPSGSPWTLAIKSLRLVEAMAKEEAVGDWRFASMVCPNSKSVKVK
jgi:hypothetical protein